METLAFGLSLIAFSMATYIVTVFVRKLSETLAPSWSLETNKIQKLWRDVILPMMPCFVGGLMGHFIVNYPYPDVFIAGGNETRIIFGIFCGAISSLIYRMTKSFIKAKIGQTNQPDPTDLLG